MRLPRIGVTAWRRTYETPIGPVATQAVNHWYVGAVELAGGIPVILPALEAGLVPDVLEIVDGLIVTGGEDVDPDRYGAARHPKTQASDGKRDGFEIAALAASEERNLPVFCICRGIQVLNVARGGTLMQDIPDLVEGHPEHMRRDVFDGDAHTVRIEPGSRMEGILGSSVVSVNSLHHQAVELVGAGLRAVGWAEEGFVEAVEDTRPDRFVIGVQWHPEILAATRPEHLAPFRALVGAARHRRPLDVC